MVDSRIAPLPSRLPASGRARRAALAAVSALAGAGLIGAGLIGAGLAGPVLAQGSASWSQFQGNAAHTGAADGPAPPYAEAWRLLVPTGGPTGQFGLSMPVVDGDTVVAVGPEEVLGIDLSTGEERWSVTRDFGPSVPGALAGVEGADVFVYTEGFGDDPPQATPSPTASPTPSPSTDDDGPFDSHVAAIDLASQKHVWKPLELDQVSRTGVTVEGDTAYLGGDDGTVFAVNIARGSVAWQAELGGDLTTPLAAVGGVVVATVQGDRDSPPAVAGLDATTGEQRWRYEGDGGAFLVSAPAVSDDTVYVGFSDQSIRALDLGSGERRWSARLNAPINFVSAPALTGDAVYALDLLGQFYRLDPTGGARVWDFAMNEAVLRSSPVVVRDYVLATTADGRLAAVETVSGDLRWQSDASGDVLRSFAVTPDLLVGVQGGTRAGLVAFEADPEGELVRVTSPTVLEPARLFGNFAIVAVPFAALVILLGGVLLRRLGPSPVEAIGAGTEDGSGDEDDA